MRTMFQSLCTDLSRLRFAKSVTTRRIEAIRSMVKVAEAEYAKTKRLLPGTTVPYMWSPEMYELYQRCSEELEALERFLQRRLPVGGGDSGAPATGPQATAPPASPPSVTNASGGTTTTSAATAAATPSSPPLPLPHSRL